MSTPGNDVDGVTALPEELVFPAAGAHARAVAEPDDFDPDAALSTARRADADARSLARKERVLEADGEEDVLFPMTADLTLARQARGADDVVSDLPASADEGPDDGAEPDADGVLAARADDIVVAADDPRRETVDDPRIPPDKLFFKIGEVSRLTGLKPYVLRYWETEFPWIRPSKTSSRQRLYRRQDIGVLLEIKRLRYEEKRTIADTKEQIRERRGLERTRRPSKPPRKNGAPAAPSAAVAAEAVTQVPTPALAAPPSTLHHPILRELRREVAELIAFVDAHAAHARA
jgi:DNA-binding transcriptional MerR regulator